MISLVFDQFLISIAFNKKEKKKAPEVLWL
jgi:hypothetical protein